MLLLLLELSQPISFAVIMAERDGHLSVAMAFRILVLIVAVALFGGNLATAATLNEYGAPGKSKMAAHCG